MRSSVLAWILVAAVAACGPGDGPAPPPDDGGGDTGGEGGGGSGGDVPSGGDQPAGGGGVPSGDGDQPSGDGETPSGAGGGSGPMTSSDGTVTIARVDASAECDGLLPGAAPSAVTASAPGGGTSCGSGISEGKGHVAGVTSYGQGFVDWQAFSPQGLAERPFRVAWNGSSTTASDVYLFPQPDGWIGASAIAWGSPVVQVDVVSLLPDGTPRGTPVRVTPGEGQSLSWSTVEDPRGGVAFVRTGNPPAGPDCAGTVWRFDETGTPRGDPATFGHGSTCVAVAAVSHAGEALVVERSGETAWLHWFAVDGSPARAAVDAGALGAIFTSGKPVFLAPLLDGSVVAWEGGVWTRRFPHLGDRAEAAPGWLASRPGFTFRNTRGERGYALLPPPGAESADCTQRIEVLAPSGRLCGTVTLSDPGGACRTRVVDQGRDGTVVQQSAREPCTWRWWPRLLGE